MEHSNFTLGDIKKDVGLWYRVNVFVYDLRNYSTDPHAQKRLEKVVDASYLGPPYFSEEEVAKLKCTIVSGTAQTLAEVIQSTLDERLERRMKKRIESDDFRVCAAHDLAPIFERALSINSKALAKDAQFRKLTTEGGLHPSTITWTGSPQKSFAPKKKHR